MRKAILTMLFAVATCLGAIAQKVAVTGKVTDSSGAGISGATVKEKGTKTGVATSDDGSFTISVAPNAVLIISSVGFTVKEVSASGNLNISLVNESNTLNEVVVTALGIQRQRKDLGYSTAKVSNAELNQAKPVNLANGLQGKVSGMNITSVNNGVFEEVKINLRGIRSLTGNNNPLLVLDGVPTNLDFLPSINPNDIADVNILKGSSAAAVYGPDARNGAIIVTTKRGTKGAPVITLSNSTQFSQVSFYPKWQTEFGSGGYGDYIPYENWSWGPAYDGSEVEVGHGTDDGSPVQMLRYSALPNERKKFFNTGVTMQNDVSFATKDFFLSVQDANVKGITPDDKNRRTGIRVNTTKEYGIFSAKFNVNYVQQNYSVFDDDAMSDYNTANNVGLNGGLLNLIFNTPAHIPITSYKDFVGNKYADYNNYFNDYGLNPYFAIDNWRKNGKKDNFISNVEFGLKATDWLSFTYRAAASIDNRSETRSSKGEVPNDFGSDRGFKLVSGTFSKRSTRNSRLSSEFFANFNKSFNDFKINAIAGTYFRQNDYDDELVGATNLVVPELFDVENRTGELSGNSEFSRTRLQSFYGTLGFSYKGWANLEVSGRTDKTSVLTPDKNSYFYPGANLSLVISDAFPGIKTATPISFIKLRGSYNKTGNADINPYQLAATFSQASGYPYGTLPGYTADNTSYDPLLRPEFIKSLEIGAEIGFFRNRVNVEATYFNQDNTDQIIPIRVSSATGYTNSYINAASFVNKGVELDLKITPLVPFRNGSINFKANATYNNSSIGNIYEGLDELFIGGYNNFAANYAIKNQPAFVFKATDYVRDDQGHVIVDETGYPQVDPNSKVFGRTMPLWTIGLNPSVNWKGITFSILAEYKGGHYAYHNIGSDMAWTGVSAATAINHRESFVFPNSVVADPNNAGKYIPNTSVVIPNVNDFFTGVYRDVATNFLTSAAAWRLREVTLAYDVPAKTLKGQKVIKGISIAVTARNLFLWVPSTNEFSDPDFSFTTGNTSGVSDSQINPPVRTIGGNISLRF